MASVTLLASTPVTAAGTGAAVSVSGYKNILGQVTCTPSNSTINFHVQYSIDGTNFYTLTTLTGNTATPIFVFGPGSESAGFNNIPGEYMRVTWTNPGASVTIAGVMSAV